MTIRFPLKTLLPGLAVVLIVSCCAFALERFEIAMTGSAWIEALVLAILVGTGVRTAWKPPARCDAGIRFAAHTILEVAVAVMGATVGVSVIMAAGKVLIASIAATVVVTIVVGFAIGRAFRLSHTMALLLACGNAICGNSAIAAVAPAIDADSDEVATAVAFTAVLGIAVVLGLPILSRALDLSPAAGGVLAGLTVYAVPQVLAAAAPMGPVAVQTGTVVKLVRVLMLGPVVASLSLAASRTAAKSEAPARTFSLASVARFLPPFIIAFFVLMLARSAGLLPASLVPPARTASQALTVIAMAGLGLGVDLASVLAAGVRVVCAVCASLAVLEGIALLVLKVCGLA